MSGSRCLEAPVFLLFRLQGHTPVFWKVTEMSNLTS